MHSGQDLQLFLHPAPSDLHRKYGKNTEGKHFQSGYPVQDSSDSCRNHSQDIQVQPHPARIRGYPYHNSFDGTYPIHSGVQQDW